MASDSSLILDYARIPPRLKDLLRREACLISSKDQLEAAIVEFQVEHQEAKVSRPPFLFLQSKAVREQFNQRLNESRETLETLQRGAAKLDELVPRLHLWITEEFERYFFSEQPAFLQGLVRHRFPGDWQRLATRVGEHCRQFSAGLDQLLQTLGTLRPEQRLAGQLHIIDLVKAVRVLGAHVDADIDLLNKIGLEQRTRGQNGAMPEIHVLKCESNVARIAMIDDINSRELLNRFATRYREASEFLSALCAQQVQYATTLSAGDLSSYVESAWDLMRTHAHNDFNPAHMERLLVETERMLNQHESK